MRPMMRTARLLAVAIVMTAFVGIFLEFQATLVHGATANEAIWALLRYFTILTNFVAAILFAAVAFGARMPRLIAGIALAMALVGLVVALLLQGLRDLSGATLIADILLHQLNPVLVAVFWVFFSRTASLRWYDPLLWALYPLAYFVYAIARGQADGIYPYPFVDVATLGWVATLRNAVFIAIAFTAAGTAMVWLDRQARIRD